MLFLSYFGKKFRPSTIVFAILQYARLERSEGQVIVNYRALITNLTASH